MGNESEKKVTHVWLCNPMDYSLSGSFVHGILQATALELVAISFSRGSSLPKDWTQVSWIVGRFFTIWATREASLWEIDFFFNTQMQYIQLKYRCDYTFHGK